MDTMAPTRKRAIALLTTAAGLGILLVAGVVLYRPMQERYWIWKLESGTKDKCRVAAERLG